MSKFYTFFLLLALSCLVILPYNHFPGTEDFDPYVYSSKAAYLATAKTFLPNDVKIQKQFHFLEHPLLFEWMQAGWFKVFGISQATSKSLVSLMGILLVLLTYGIGAWKFSPMCGFLAGLFLLISPKYMIFSSINRLDLPLVFFISLSIFSAFWVRKEKTWPLLFSGFFMGCAMLIKGPFGMLCAPVIAFYFLVSRQFFILKSPFFYMALFLPKICIWVYNFLLSFETPNVTLIWRTTNLIDYNYFFYILALFKNYLYLTPALFLLPFVFKKLNAKEKPIYLACFIWIFITIGALSWVPAKKIGYYLFPINPAFSLLFAIGLEKLLNESIKKRVLQGALIVTIFLAFVFSTTPFKLHKYKIFKQAGFYEQYFDLQYPIQKILDAGHPLYFFSGDHYILNFLFPKEFNQKKFKWMDELDLTGAQDPVYIISRKPIAINLQNKTLFLIAETKNLYIVSTVIPAKVGV